MGIDCLRTVQRNCEGWCGVCTTGLYCTVVDVGRGKLDVLGLESYVGSDDKDLMFRD